MLLLALLVLISGARARIFNVTHFIVPAIVHPGQTEVEMECRYEGNFTLLNWFKGQNEFFRYRPGAAPSTRSFPVLGVGTVEMLMCGPTICRLRLGELTEEASGIYRCDIERDVPPYKYATQTAAMQVIGQVHRKPLVEGLSKTYGEGDLIQAYCRAELQTEIRWYINAREIVDMRGSRHLKYVSKRKLYAGNPPTIIVQCSEVINDKEIGSEGVKANWNGTLLTQENYMMQTKEKNNAIEARIHSIIIVLCLYIPFM